MSIAIDLAPFSEHLCNYSCTEAHPALKMMEHWQKLADWLQPQIEERLSDYSRVKKILLYWDNSDKDGFYIGVNGEDEGLSIETLFDNFFQMGSATFYQNYGDSVYSDFVQMVVNLCALQCIETLKALDKKNVTAGGKSNSNVFIELRYLNDDPWQLVFGGGFYPNAVFNDAGDINVADELTSRLDTALENMTIIPCCQMVVYGAVQGEGYDCNEALRKLMRNINLRSLSTSHEERKYLLKAVYYIKDNMRESAAKSVEALISMLLKHIKTDEQALNILTDTVLQREKLVTEKLAIDIASAYADFNDHEKMLPWLKTARSLGTAASDILMHKAFTTFAADADFVAAIKAKPARAAAVINAELAKACYELNFESVKLLVEEGGDANFVSKSHRSLIELAADCFEAGLSDNHDTVYELLSYLLESGAQIEEDSLSWVTDKPIKFYELFITHGAKANVRAFNCALKTDNEEVIKVLLADEELVDTLKQTEKGPWGECKNIAVAQILMDAGIPLDFSKSCRWHDALSTEGLCEWYLQNGIDINTLDFNGGAVIHNLISRDDAALVQKYLDLGAELDLPDDHGRTPLHRSADDNRYDMVKFFLEAGGDINKQDSVYQYTALHYAVDYQRKNIVKLLLEHGAHTDLRDKEGLLAIDKTSSIEFKKLLDPEFNQKDQDCALGEWGKQLQTQPIQHLSRFIRHLQNYESEVATDSLLAVDWQAQAQRIWQVLCYALEGYETIEVILLRWDDTGEQNSVVLAVDDEDEIIIDFSELISDVYQVSATSFRDDAGEHIYAPVATLLTNLCAELTAQCMDACELLYEENELLNEDVLVGLSYLHYERPFVIYGQGHKPECLFDDQGRLAKPLSTIQQLEKAAANFDIDAFCPYVSAACQSAGDAIEALELLQGLVRALAVEEYSATHEQRMTLLKALKTIKTTLYSAFSDEIDTVVGMAVCFVKEDRVALDYIAENLLDMKQVQDKTTLKNMACIYALFQEDQLVYRWTREALLKGEDKQAILEDKDFSAYTEDQTFLALLEEPL
ncbi:MAG: ankyrin repeat domain-containing protein [Pseudomonadales bacterium]|nr:ankyrin repeat domain-containing protein [Pseudomonadales bacterium]